MVGYFKQIGQKIKANIEENIEFRKEIKNIEKEEYKKAKKLEAVRFAKTKAKIETNKKLERLKKPKGKTKGIFGIEGPKIKIDPPKPIKFNTEFPKNKPFGNSIYEVTKPKNVK